MSHPDVTRVGERAILWGVDAKQGEAELARRQLEFRAPRDGSSARPLGDPYVSRRPIRFAAARFGGIRIDASKTGTRVIAAEDWISEDRVFLGVEVDRGVVLILSERVALLLHNLEPQVDESAVPDFGLVGDSPGMIKLRREIRRSAETRHPVLLRGAPGSGKKTVARAIHGAGQETRPFVTVRLVGEPELSVPDLLERSDGGTLMLDAVHNIDGEFQAELVESLDKEPRDVRILAATDLDLRRRGEDRGRLVDQLIQDTIEIPALHERRDDVARLTYYFLREQLAELDALSRLDNPGPYTPPWLPVRLIAILAAYEWPHNVRQLRRVTGELARRFHSEDHVEMTNDLDELLEDSADSTSLDWPVLDSGRDSKGRKAADISEIELLAALRAHQWQVEPAAAHLGVSAETLFAMIDKFSEKTRRNKRDQEPNLF